MTSRAMLLDAPGRALRMVDRDPPVAGAGEVVVAMLATSVNNHDLLNIEGAYRNLPYPRVPFSDGCGTVVDVGEGVAALRMGDRVIAQFFPLWSAGPPSAAVLSVVRGDHVDGCLQTHQRAPADSFVKAPEHLSAVEAASLGCAGLTAWRSLVVEARVKPGDVVVVQGSGGVSTFAMGIARCLGATVIATSSSDEKLEKARAIGATECVNYVRDREWSERVLALTDGRGADHIVEVGGPDTFGQSVQAVRIGGHISVIGALTGKQAADVSLRAIMGKNITVKGLTVGSRADLQDFCRMVRASGYRPSIGAVFAWDDVQSALEAMRSQKHFGKLALQFPE